MQLPLTIGKVYICSTEKKHKKMSEIWSSKLFH